MNNWLTLKDIERIYGLPYSTLIARLGNEPDEELIERDGVSIRRVNKRWQGCVANFYKFHPGDIVKWVEAYDKFRKECTKHGPHPDNVNQAYPHSAFMPVGSRGRALRKIAQRHKALKEKWARGEM